MLRTVTSRFFSAVAPTAGGVNASRTALRAFATGPASGGHISDELLEKLGGLTTQALVDGLWVKG